VVRLYSLSQNLAFHDKYRDMQTTVFVFRVPPGSEWPSGASNLLSEFVGGKKRVAQHIYSESDLSSVKNVLRIR